MDRYGYHIYERERDSVMAREDNGVLIAEGVRDFDLDDIFDCGQCFRWEKTADGMYAGTAHGRVAVMEGGERGKETNVVEGQGRGGGVVGGWGVGG